MRLCYLLLVIFLGSASSDAPYFCTTSGNLLEYTRTYAKNSKVKWYHQMNIISSDLDSLGNGKVEYSSWIFSEKRKPKTPSPITMTAVINEGKVHIDLSQTMISMMKSFAGDSFSIESSGGETVLPAVLSPSDTLPDASTSVKLLGMTMRISVTERKILRYETLTTPAGTFDCVVISEHKVEKGMGRHRITTAHTWYARGIGMVRHDTYDKNLILETSEILTHITTSHAN